jgi:hypothetical protein
MPLLGEKVKPSTPYRKISRHVKHPCGVLNKHYIGEIPGHFTQTLYFKQRALVDQSGMIRTHRGMHNKSENGHST